MIEFNKILNPRLVTYLVRVFGMKVGGSPAPTLAPEVAPSVDVNQQDDVTLRFIRGERAMALNYAFAASVGNINRLQIRNPSTSGVLIVVTGVVHNGATVFQHGVGLQTGDLAGGSIQPQPRDSRWFATGGTRGAGVATWDQTAAPTVPVQYMVPANQGGFAPCEIVVPPGSAWQGQNGSANAADYVVVEYYERAVAAEELATG